VLIRAKMKKLLTTLLLILTIALQNVMFLPLTSAATTEDSGFESFDVGNILSNPSSDAEGENSSLLDSLQEKAEASSTDQIDSPLIAGILRVINIMMLLIGTFAFVTLFIGGIMMVTANGEEGKIDRSKAILTQSIFGLIIAFMSYFIVTFVQSFFY
jgi:hypothetical protein